MKSYIKQLFPFIISATCVMYVFWNINYGHLLTSFRTFNLGPILIAQSVMLLVYALLPARIRFLSAGQARYSTCFHATFIAAALNNTLPAKLGEGAKVVILNSETKMPVKDALTIVFWERFADLNIILCAGLLATFHMGTLSLLFPMLGLIGAVWSILILASIWPEVVTKIVSALPWEGARQYCQKLTSQLTNKLRIQTLAPLALYTVTIWTLVLCSFFLALGYGTELSLTTNQIFVVFVASVIGAIIPSAPASIGVYESFVVGALLLFNVPKEEGLAIAITLHLIQIMLPTIIGAMLFPRLSGSPLVQIKYKLMKHK